MLKKINWIISYLPVFIGVISCSSSSLFDQEPSAKYGTINAVLSEQLRNVSPEAACVNELIDMGNARARLTDAQTTEKALTDARNLLIKQGKTANLDHKRYEEVQQRRQKAQEEFDKAKKTYDDCINPPVPSSSCE